MDPITSFSVSSTHIAFAAKSPYLNVESHTREDVYILPLHLSSSAIQPSHHTPGTHGAMNGVTFSPDGMQLAELEMAKDEYESYRRVWVHELKSGSTKRWTQNWVRSPISIHVSAI